MTPHRLLNLTLAALIALGLSAAHLLGGPSELDAIQATAESVIDAQAAAQAAAATHPRPALLATKDQP